MKQPQFINQKLSDDIYASELARRTPRFKIHNTLRALRSSRSTWTFDKDWRKDPNGWFDLGGWRGSSLERAREACTFDAYKRVDGQWVYLPEESHNPDDYEFEVRDHVTNAWSVKHQNHTPRTAKRYFARRKEATK